MMNSKYLIAAVLGLTISINSYPSDFNTVKQISDSIISSMTGHSIWSQLRANFKLNHYHGNAQVVKAKQRYLNENFQLNTVLKRGAPYFNFIAQELKKRNMPMELIFLPLIESEYNPTARSHKNASGLWQLMPATAKVLGLEPHQRNDVYASTRAALNHLNYLNKKFNGDWLVTLAAYNAGEVVIDRAIKQNRAAGKSIDFWSLNIPYAETRAYVPRFLAVIDIIENADDYDLDLPTIPHRSSLTKI